MVAESRALPARLPGPRGTDPGADRALARRLGVSDEALALVRRSEVVDLHIDSFIPVRIFGYALDRHHPRPLTSGRFMGHLDWPRMEEGGLTGGMWSITTNPFRRAGRRWAVFQANLARLRALVEGSAGRLRIARTRAEYDAARADGAHAVLLSIQGGNALQAAPDGPASIPDRAIVRVTLVHLTNSDYGATSSPAHLLRSHKGLTPLGRRFVEQLDAERILVDLAHIHPQGFWDAVDVHDRALPLVSTHTGVAGVTPHWRNLDDRQLKALADSGGTAGIIFSYNFLQRRGGPRDAGMVIEHVEHVVKVCGEDFVSIGSDYDGMIVPPRDLTSSATYPVLVQHLLDRGHAPERIQKFLGGNALRVLQSIRP